ncbi:MAG: UbiA prenyltransferase family protein [Candidatus Diapherotrites archaeon]|nr:UbiA prenyltransferase family protein [Candidatus Diapherotrites archaeon]
MFGRIAALIELMRPVEWSKTFGNMVLGSVLALYLTNQPIFTLNNFYLFLIGFIAAGPLLWGGLYTLNDYYDWKKDLLHKVKKTRAIPSGRISANAALLFSLLLIFLAIFIGGMSGALFFVCIAVMFFNQILYTSKPFRLKERAVFDLISGSLINPIFRFYAGWVLFASAFNAPIEVLLFVVGFQFAGFTLYRLSNKKLETKLTFRSSNVVFGEKKIRYLAYAAGAIAGLSYLIMCFTILPPRFLILAVLSVLAFPLYAKALSKPQEMDMRRMYKLIYAHYTLFIIGFILLFYVQF